MGPVRRLLMLPDMHELLKNKLWFMQEFIYEGGFGSAFANAYMAMCAFFIFIDRFPSHCCHSHHPACVFALIPDLRHHYSIRVRDK